jgi:hypothetical protein
MEHADKLVVRITFLEGFPNLQLLDPLRIGQNGGFLGMGPLIKYPCVGAKQLLRPLR